VPSGLWLLEAAAEGRRGSLLELSPVSKQTTLRSLFFAFWFALVPALLALLAVWLLVPAEANESGAFSQVRLLVKDQPVPAVIVLFTLFEMALYAIRDRLPLAALSGYAGPPGLSRELRAEYEQARSLLEEAHRILIGKRRAVEREVAPSDRESISKALDQLRDVIAAEPFSPEDFRESYQHASTLVSVHLERWQKGELREYAESILVAVLVALLLRAFVIEAFKIPSGSMLPTLQLQDHIFVNKLAYGPMIPFTNTRLWHSLPPKRGDIIVFEYPDPEPNPRPDYIKRVIALPGDTLEVIGGHPILNGWKVPSCKVGPYEFEEGEGVTKHGDLYVEFLGDYSYLTVYESIYGDEMTTRDQGPYHVAAGEIWVLGDNRNNSSDSRAWNHNLGAGAPFENIKGRALFVWLSFGPDGWPTLDRFLTNVMGRPRLPEQASPALARGITRCLKERPQQTTPPPPTAP